MGSRIAAHFANAGIPALLLDIVLPGNANRNAAALAGIENATKQKPGAFFTPDAAKLVTPGNFEDNLKDIRRCDWVIEAVTENLDVKRGLMAKVSILRTPGTRHLHQHQRYSASHDFRRIRPRVPPTFPGHPLFQSTTLFASAGSDSRR